MRLGARVSRLERWRPAQQGCPACGDVSEWPLKLVLSETDEEPKSCPLCGRSLSLVLRLTLDERAEPQW